MRTLSRTWLPLIFLMGAFTLPGGSPAAPAAAQPAPVTPAEAVAVGDALQNAAPNVREEAAQKAAPRLRARDVFDLLPASIFENTAEGLTDAEKQELLTRGQTEFWEITGEGDDIIVFTALPFHDSAIALRIFPNAADDSLVAAIGTLDVAMCTMELWRVDSNNRIVPIDTPEEPAIGEFLAKGQSLPRNVNPTVLICVGHGGLKAQPVFWTSSGMVHLPLANDISFQWNGREFVKLVSPHAGKPAPDSGTSKPR